VVGQLDGSSGSFSDPSYAGSELQSVLLEIWNAARLLSEAREQGYALALATASNVKAAIDRKDVALAESNKLAAEYNLLEQEYSLSNAQTLYQIRQTTEAARSALASAGRDVRYSCKQEEGKGAGCSSDCVKWAQPLPVPGFDGPLCLEEKKVCGIDTRTSAQQASDMAKYCRGHANSCGKKLGKDDTALAANMRCRDAVSRYTDAAKQQQSSVKSTNELLSSLNGVEPSRLEAMVKRREAISEQKTSADSAYSAEVASTNVQMSSHYAIITQQDDALILALSKLDLLRLRATQSKDRASLEEGIAKSQYSSNTAIRQRFRSYDMWRAKALLESTRRLAVTARRAIEARFVVDLSSLSADQAFVASPSGWADEIFESDLNAPEVVGLSLVPKVEGAIYPNKLIDYIGNLERFVQGYTISYPTSVSLPDTEVLSFGGPDQVESPSSVGVAKLSDTSSGWRFYCPNTKTWIAHPGFGQYPLSTRLSTACNGESPTLAKLGFWLDPWGTLNGAWSRPVYSDRHNVRWRRLALNLVGTGIRDCTKSTDSMSCYTNPYVRYDLLHGGPSWQTSHSLDWRSLDIPIAHIEGGKALAAEEWLEPINNSWNMPYVSNVARGEFFGRPTAGNYELILKITPDVRLDRIERVQLLAEEDYWVRQTNGARTDEPVEPALPPVIIGFKTEFAQTCAGNSVMLTPLFANGTGVISGGIGAVKSNIPVSTGPISANTTFKLTVTNSIGQKAEASVSVNALPKGKFTPTTVLAGGTGLQVLPNGHLLAGNLLYDPSSNVVTTIEKPSQCRSIGPSAALLDGKILLVCTNSDWTRSYLIFDPATGQTQAAGTQAEHVYWMRVFTLPTTGQVVFIGGFTVDFDPSTALEVFTRSDVGGASSVLHKQSATQLLAATLLSDGRVLIAGGEELSQYTPQSTAEIYTPGLGSTGTIRSIGSMPVARTGAGIAPLSNGDALIAGGGSSSEQGDRIALIFNGATNTFRFATGQLNFPRFTPALVPMKGGKVLVFSGFSLETGSWEWISQAEVYDPNTESFSVLPETLVTRQNAEGVQLPNGAVLLTGYSSTGQPSTELYCP
jgi:hypothetical protein